MFLRKKQEKRKQMYLWFKNDLQRFSLRWSEDSLEQWLEAWLERASTEADMTSVISWKTAPVWPACEPLKNISVNLICTCTTEYFQSLTAKLCAWPLCVTHQQEAKEVCSSELHLPCHLLSYVRVNVMLAQEESMDYASIVERNAGKFILVNVQKSN